MLLSSHILPEVSMICSRVLVINDGRIVADDKPSALSARLQHAERIEVGVRGGQQREVIAALRELTSVVDARTDARAESQQRALQEKRLALIVDARPNTGAPQAIAKTVVEKGWGLTVLNPLPMTLEEIFLELTTDEDLDS